MTMTEIVQDCGSLPGEGCAVYDGCNKHYREKLTGVKTMTNKQPPNARLASFIRATAWPFFGDSNLVLVMTDKQPSEAAMKQAEPIVGYLFVNGAGSKAERLVLTSADGRDLGGWGKPAVLDCIARALDAAREEGRMRAFEDLYTVEQVIKKAARADGRRAGIEEAAKVAEQLYPDLAGNYLEEVAELRIDCAGAIRALLAGKGK